MFSVQKMFIGFLYLLFIIVIVSCLIIRHTGEPVAAPPTFNIFIKCTTINNDYTSISFNNIFLCFFFDLPQSGLEAYCVVL